MIRVQFVSLCLTLLAGAAGAVEPFIGVWKSNSGSTVVIPETSAKTFPILIAHPDGTTAVSARWERGRDGIQATYLVSGSVYTATLDPRDGKIHVSGGGGVSIWTGAGAYQPKWGFAGVWKSTAGGTWYAVPIDHAVHLMAVGAKGEVDYIAGSWVDGRVAVQFYYDDGGSRWYINIVPETPKTVHVVDSAGNFVGKWEKQRNFPAGGGNRVPAPPAATPTPGWSRDQAFDVWVEGFHLTRVTVSNPAACSVKVDIDYAAPGIPYAALQAKVALDDDYTITTEAWSETQSGSRRYSYTADTAGQGCWAKKPRAPKSLQATGCYSAGCSVPAIP